MQYNKTVIHFSQYSDRYVNCKQLDVYYAVTYVYIIIYYSRKLISIVYVCKPFQILPYTEYL